MPITLNGTTGIVGPDGSAATPSLAGADTNTGVFFPAADTVAIATGGTEAMRARSLLAVRKARVELAPLSASILRAEVLHSI